MATTIAVSNMKGGVAKTMATASLGAELAMDSYDAKPSLSQVKRLKQMKQSGALTVEKIYAVLSEVKKLLKEEATGSARFSKYFPPNYSQKQIDKVIIGLLQQWSAGGSQ